MSSSLACGRWRFKSRARYKCRQRTCKHEVTDVVPNAHQQVKYHGSFTWTESMAVPWNSRCGMLKHPKCSKTMHTEYRIKFVFFTGNGDSFTLLKKRYKTHQTHYKIYGCFGKICFAGKIHTHIS